MLQEGVFSSFCRKAFSVVYYNALKWECGGWGEKGWEMYKNSSLFHIKYIHIYFLKESHISIANNSCSPKMVSVKALKLVSWV